MTKLAQKYRDLNVRSKAAFWFVVCSVVQKGISFITTPIFTRMMTKAQFGTYSVFCSWLQVFTVVCTLYLYYGVTDNAMAKFEDDRDRFLASMQGLCITVTTGFFLLALLFMRGAQALTGLAPVMLLLMFAEIYVSPALAFWSGRQRFEYRYKRMVAVTLLIAVLNPALGLLAVHLSENKPLARVISTVAVDAVICGVIMAVQFRKGKSFYHRAYWKYALGLALPMLPHYLSGMILNHGDKIMISRMVGEAEVALYGVAYSIGMLVQVFVSAVNNALTPWIYARLKAREIAPIQRRSRGVLALIFCVAVGLMMVAPEVMWIFGRDYKDAAEVVPPVAASVFFIFLYGFLSYPEFYYEKTAFLSAASIAAALLNILLNYIFISRYGYVAAAYTTLACYVLYSLGHYIVGGRIQKKQTGDRTIICEKTALLLSVSLILISVFAHLLFPWPLVRGLILLAGLIFAVVRRKDILAMLSEKE